MGQNYNKLVYFLISLKMNKIEQYELKCAITSQKDVSWLHIEVHSLKFDEEYYSKHYLYSELPAPIRLIFKNIIQVYLYLMRKELVYFDEEESAAKLCILIAGQYKQFSIPLESKCKDAIIKQKILFYEQQKAKLRDQFISQNQQKQVQLSTLQQSQSSVKEQVQKQQSIYNELVLKNQKLEEENINMRKESEKTMEIIRKLKPYDRIPDLKQMENLSVRKTFWIEEIKRLKNEKLSKLKFFINEKIDFEGQINLELRSIELKKMLFVEIFLNLEILDLSKNQIKQLEGLQNVRNLLKLNLSENLISSLKGLENQTRLVELILNKNKIKQIDNIFHMSQLQILRLNQNEIEIVPDSIYHLIKLVQLQLINNQIKNISTKVERLKNLKIFYVNGNKCYSDKNKSKDVINRLMRNEVKTAIQNSVSFSKS